MKEESKFFFANYCYFIFNIHKKTKEIMIESVKVSQLRGFRVGRIIEILHRKYLDKTSILRPMRQPLKSAGLNLMG